MSREGATVFEKANFYTNDAAAGWDGTLRGSKLSTDVYIYAIEITGADGKAKIISVILGSAAEATSRKSSTPAPRGITQLLLFSISALRVDEGAKAPSATVVPKTDTTPDDRSERRQVTVMFSDLGLKTIN